MTDPALERAIALVQDSLAGHRPCPQVHSFFDPDSSTVSHLVRDPTSNACAILDSVLDFDPASGRTATRSAQPLIDTVREQGLQVHWLLETHAHADHLSAAALLQRELGGQLAIGADIVQVQRDFSRLFNRATADGQPFDHLYVDGESFRIGNLHAIALHVPGHTPACLAYVIGDAVFVGDTLFMPDYGTARCDFPGGDAATLYRSIQRLLKLPAATRMFLCHDYRAPGREHYAWETTVQAQREGNVHIAGVDQASFVAQRQARDAQLPVPRLLLPAVQVNLEGGRLPEPEANGVRYLKVPIDVF